FSNNFPYVFLLANLGTLAVVWYGGVEVIGARLTIGELIAFNTYLNFLLFPILSIGFLSAGISRAGASSLRVFEILDAPLDVRDVRGVTLASLRSQIGIVLQETLLFSGTVRDNIAYGRPDASQAEVEAAARAAQADGFIRELPNGYQTVIGERGVGLSG